MKKLCCAMILTMGVGMASTGWTQDANILEPAIRGEAVTNDAPPPPPAPAAPAAPTPTPTPPPPTTMGEEQINQIIRMRMGEDHFLSAQAVRMQVSNPNVITATQLPDRSGILVTSKSRGISDLRLWDSAGNMTIYRFQVSGMDLTEELRSLRELLSEVPTVNAKRVGDHLVVSGTLLSPEDERRFDEIVRRFDVLDMTERRYNTVELQRRVEELNDILRARDLDGVEPRLVNTANGVVLYLGGEATREDEKELAENLAGMYFQDVQNDIVISEELVELDVVMITVDLSQLDIRGQNLFNQINDMRFDIGTVDENGTFLLPGWGGGTGDAGLRGEEIAYTWIPSGTVLATLQAIKDERYVSYYAEPFIAVQDGETAVFQDGATAYVALASEDSVGVAEVETGLQAEVTPLIQENGDINVEVAVDFSVESENVPSFEGSGIAGTLNVKRARTETMVEIEDGETIVIAGNNSNLFRQNKNETPLLSKIPVVNLFFMEKDRERTNVRSFFFITPRLTTTRFNQGEEPFSRQAPKAKDYYKLDSRGRPSDPGYWLGWEKNLPDPDPQPTPLPEDRYMMDDMYDADEN